MPYSYDALGCNIDSCADGWDGLRYGGYLAIPLNNEGNRALVQELSDDENVLWVAISPDECRMLMPLFQRFNSALRLSIGVCAGEVLYLKDVVEALELACAFEREVVETPVHDAVRKVVQAVQTALECGSYVEFDV